MARHRNNNGEINNNTTQQNNSQESVLNNDIFYDDDSRIVDLAGTILSRLFGGSNNITLLISFNSFIESANPEYSPDNAFVLGARIESRPSAFPAQFLDYIKDIIEQSRKRQNLKKDLHRNKPYAYKKSMDPAECTVCLNDFKEKELVRKLDCQHEFHKKCIDKWLLQGNMCCPLCRKEPFSVIKK